MPVDTWATFGSNFFYAVIEDKLTDVRLLHEIRYKRRVALITSCVAKAAGVCNLSRVLDSGITPVRWFHVPKNEPSSTLLARRLIHTNVDRSMQIMQWRQTRHYFYVR